VKETGSFEAPAMRELIEASAGNIRGALNALEMELICQAAYALIERSCRLRAYLDTRLFPPAIGGEFLMRPAQVPKQRHARIANAANEWSASSANVNARPKERHEREEQARRARSRAGAYDSPWDVLGVRPGCSGAEIRSAWKRACKLHHPDIGGDVEQMKRANKAYSDLKGQMR